MDGIQTPVTVGGLIITSIFLIVLSFAPRIYDWLKLRAEIKEREQKIKLEAELEAAKAEAEKDEKVWDRVVREYERQIERGNRLEVEADQLRPLALANAILEQKMQQCREDKDDWKAHALSLEEQLTSNNIIPRPFRRQPRQEETQEKLRTISRKMKAIKAEASKDRPATSDSPTLVFPPEEVESTGGDAK